MSDKGVSRQTRFGLDTMERAYVADRLGNPDHEQDSYLLSLSLRGALR
jgi:hypothetical protein